MSTESCPPQRRKDVRDFAPSLVSMQPNSSTVVIACGSLLRGFSMVDREPLKMLDISDSSERHGNVIRCMSFSTDGSYLATGGDDKLIKLWNTTSWSCVKTLRSPKKVSALALTPDSSWITFADKYGTVFGAPTAVADTESTPGSLTAKSEPGHFQLLAHCCSIITGLAVSPDSRFIASADRDFKIRISEFPRDPSQGVHVIQTFCLGHSLYVTAVAFLHNASSSLSPSGFVVSSSADGTIRVWCPETGKQLSCLHLDSYLPDGAEEATGKHQDGRNPRAVSNLAVLKGSNLMAASLEGSQAISFIEWHAVDKKLIVLQELELATSPPSSLSFDSHGRLWTVTGAMECPETSDAYISPESQAALSLQVAQSSDSTNVVVQLAAQHPETRKYHLLTGESMPGGTAMLNWLQGKGRTDFNIADVARDARLAELAVRTELSKREFSEEDREYRKRDRNDKK